MTSTRKVVETVLYGAGTQRRFTQDGPVLPDVWVEYLEETGRRLPLLLVPWQDGSPSDLVSALKKRIAGEPGREEMRIIYNRTVAIADLTMEEMVRHVIPFTGWYLGALRDGRARQQQAAQREEAARREVGADNAAATPAIDKSPFIIPPLPALGQLWDDLVPPSDRRYEYPKLLSTIRIVGLIAFLAKKLKDGGRDRKKVEVDVARASADSETCRVARAALAERMMQGWIKTFGEALPSTYLDACEEAEERGLIYAVNRNRAATVALTNSVRIVKGDAAHAVFSISCKKLVWAVIDSGIDATHPAFLSPSKPGHDKPQTDVDKLKHSRVKETYDFSYLRELLVGKRELPELYKRNLAKDDMDERLRHKEMVQRVRNSRAIDWGLLRPILRVWHQDSYSKPTDGHGTHVAGILAADWPDGPGGGMQGMCPDIRLIDIRVCREGGTSDEFVIMSALQFLRYLNANADFMVVHGVNMSLSLVHDAANYACGRTPVCEEATRTVGSGMVVVAAAGNLGYRRLMGEANTPYEQFCPVSITDPGNAQAVITVGSTHRMEPYTYGVSYFSSRGPTGDGRSKPDLVAPGEKIFAPTLGDEAVRLDGTSMAAPHVSGAAAMLMARHVELTGEPERIKTILCKTASDLGRERYFQGHGLVDVLRAIQSV